MTEPSQRTERNRFLAVLSPGLFRRLDPELEAVALARGTILSEPGRPEDHVYFPDCGLVSLVKIMSDGRSAEVGCIGIEGLVGLAPLIGMEPSRFQNVVQLEGYGRRISAATLRSELDLSDELKALALHYLSHRVDQLAQTAACNRLHTLLQRCCRWLLTARDNATSDTFALTHEFLALMMGVNRPPLSIALARLQKRGLIAYQRGSITIRQRRALEEATCECYGNLVQSSEKMYRA